MWGTSHLVPGAVSVTSAGAAGAFGVQEPHLSRSKMVTSTPEQCKVTSEMCV